LNSEN